MSISKVKEATQNKWKIAAYTGMYDDLVEFTGINKKTLRDAIKHGIGTNETVDAINKFFQSKKVKI